MERQVIDMNMKTMDGLIGARMNIDMMDVPIRVYKEARLKGDTATMERAMDYAGKCSDKAWEYEAKADEGMKEEAKEEPKGAPDEAPLYPPEIKNVVVCGRKRPGRRRGAVRVVVEEEQEVQLHPGELPPLGHRVKGLVVQALEEQHIVPKSFGHGGPSFLFCFELFAL